MRTILATLAITFAVVLIAGAVAVYSGVYDIGATAPHWRITHWVMETARVRSIKAHAAGITAPPGLDDPTRMPMGTEHFAAHCAVCHGAPGVPNGDIANGLYPQPLRRFASTTSLAVALVLIAVKFWAWIAGLAGGGKGIQTLGPSPGGWLAHRAALPR